MNKFSQYMYFLGNKIDEYACNEEIVNPKVSVIVPVYNSEEYLDRCILSLLKQSLKEIEIILVDDGSKDNSYSILTLFASLNNRIKVIRQKNQKQGAARNNGLQHAHAEFVTFVDSDDEIPSDYLENLYKTAKQYNADITIANMIKHKTMYSKPIVKHKKQSCAFSIDDKIKLCCDKKRNFFYCINKMYKREFLNQHNILFPEKVFFEDIMFSAQTIFYAQSVVTEPNAIYHYHSNKNSTVKSKKQLKKKTADMKKARKNLQIFAHNHNFKLYEKFNYHTKENKNFFLQKLIGEYKEKTLLFGIIPINTRSIK